MADVNLSIAAKLEGIDSSIKQIQALSNEATKSAQKTSEQFEKANKTLSTFGSGIGKAALAFTAINQGIEILGKLAGALTAPIHAAIESENAFNELNTALALSGNYSEQAAEDFDKFAKSIQQTTKFEDDAVIKAGALLESITNLDEEGLKRATKSAVDLSATLGKDLTTTAQMVAKAIETGGGGLAKYGIAAKNTGTEAEKLEYVLASLQKKFGGAAEAQVNTFDGAISQLNNSFGDLQETVGDAIIKNQTIIASIKKVSSAFGDANGPLKDIADTFSQAIPKAIVFAVDSFGGLLKVLKFSYQAGQILTLGIVSLVSALGDIPAAAKAVATLDFKALSDISTKNIDAYKGALDDILDNKVLDKLIQGTEDLSRELDKVATSDAGNKLSEQFKKMSASAKAAAKDIQTVLPEALKKVIEAHKNAGKTELEIASETRQSELFIIQDAIDKGILSTSEGAKQKALIESDYAAKTTTIFKKESEEQEKNNKESLDKQNAEYKKFVDNVNAVLGTIASSIKIVFDVAKAKKDVAEFTASIPEKIKQFESDIASSLEELTNKNQTQFDKAKKKSEQEILDFENSIAGSLDDTAKQLQENGATQEEIDKAVADKRAELEQELLDKKTTAEQDLADLKASSDEELLNKKNDLDLELFKEKQDLQKELDDKQKETDEKAKQAGAELVGGISHAIGDVLLPGSGAAIGAIVTGLAQGGDFLKETFLQIAGTVTTILQNMGDAIVGLLDGIISALPDIVFGLIDGVIKMVDKLVAEAPRLITELVAKIPVIIQGIIDRLPEITSALSTAMPTVATTLATELVKQAPKIIKEMIAKIPDFLFELAKGIGQAIIDAVKSLFGGIGSLFGGGDSGGGGILDSITGLFGFADGGQISGKVPSGFANDSFRTNLTSGELVVDRTDTNRLSSFLDQQATGQGINDRLDQLISSQQSNSGQPLTINLKIGEKDLADVILNLNRQGFRTA
jgi:hypothetical protein